MPPRAAHQVVGHGGRCQIPGCEKNPNFISSGFDNNGKLEYEESKNKDEDKNKEYSIIIGPMLNQDADNLFQILISKGYKQSKIIIN